MRSVCVNATLYNIFIGGRENARGMDAVNSNVLNVYIRDIVFKLFCWGLPPSKFFFTPLPYCCAGAAQPYKRLCICSSSLLTRSKRNINSSCQVFGLHRVEVQRPISKPYIYILGELKKKLLEQKQSGLRRFQLAICHFSHIRQRKNSAPPPDVYS